MMQEARSFGNDLWEVACCPSGVHPLGWGPGAPSIRTKARHCVRRRGEQETGEGAGVAEGSGRMVSWALGLGHSQGDSGWHRPRGHEQRRPWAALTPHAPRLSHSLADCLHPASQALGLPDAQASGLTRPGCVAWRPACASRPPAPVTAALFSTLPLSVFPSWKWSHPHHSLPCPLIFRIRSSRRQSPHLHGPNHLHPHPIGRTQRHLHGAPTSSLGTGPRWR